ncbi:hypothetical protein [Nocardioides terrisoli]|uniref:hypothetical protein n=1 Tax=Nocardioides terrisoli TaxID=3388267 RepID=UPI00287BABA1|nr:hypothetical protein [Nocardioides marmorisolisilvae]
MNDDPALTCTKCTRPLTHHCKAGLCGWLICSNRTCEAGTFDTVRGVLVLRGGTVERLRY